MQQLKWKVPEGYEVDKVDTTSGEIILKEKLKDVRDRFKSVDDILAAHGWTDASTFYAQNKDLPSDVSAYWILRMIAESLNEGWIPNWDDVDQYKYAPWFDMRGGSSGFRVRRCDGWRSFSDVGSRLCFKSSELAEHAGTLFIDVYRTYMVI